MSHSSKDLPEVAFDALVARERIRVVAPLTEWQTLSARLRDEGLIRSPSEPSEKAFEAVPGRLIGVPHRRLGRGGVWQWGLRVVAGTALLGIGVVAGLGWSTGTQVAAAIRGHMRVGAVDTVADNDTGSRHGVTVADRGDTFTSPEAAKQVLVRSQSEYQRAAAYLAASDTSAQIVGHASSNPVVYQVRLAMLDKVIFVLKDAAPQDPVLHQYYQTTVAARAATEQQWAQALPAGTRITHY